MEEKQPPLSPPQSAPLIDQRGAQTADQTYGNVAGGSISSSTTHTNTTHGADGNRVLALLQRQIDKDTQFRELYEAAFTKLAERVEEIDRQLVELRGQIVKGDAAVLSMADSQQQAFEATINERLLQRAASTDTRLQGLESGALYTIMTRLEADANDRRERQAVTDLTSRIVLWGIAAVFILGCMLVILVVLVEIR